jgi:hypothetical protein
VLDADDLCNAPPMNTSVIVWDLETEPDLRGFAVSNGLAGKTNDDCPGRDGFRSTSTLRSYASVRLSVSTADE